jgi:hypothetical protein
MANFQKTVDPIRPPLLDGTHNLHQGHIVGLILKPFGRDEFVVQVHQAKIDQFLGSDRRQGCKGCFSALAAGSVRHNPDVLFSFKRIKHKPFIDKQDTSLLIDNLAISRTVPPYLGAGHQHFSNHFDAQMSVWCRIAFVCRMRRKPERRSGPRSKLLAL